MEAASNDLLQAFALKTRTANLLLRQGRVGPLAEGAWGASVLSKVYTATGAAALTPAAHSRSFGIFGFQEVALGGAGPSLQVGGRVDDYRIGSRTSGKFGAGRWTRAFRAFSGSLGYGFGWRRGLGRAQRGALLPRAHGGGTLLGRGARGDGFGGAG